MPWLSSALLFFLAAVVLHAVVCRVPMQMNIVLRFVAIGGLLGLGWIWLLHDAYQFGEPRFWAGLLIYALCCEVYVFLFTLVIASISANLLVSLRSRDMTDLDIDQLYDSRKMVSARLDRLVSTRFLSETPTGLRLSEKGVRTLRVFNMMKSFFRHPPPNRSMIDAPCQ
jgi:hypothetical protein